MTTPAPPLTEACSYCHGVRLVGWSGAGPILCPECSRGENAFTVITQAWREQRAKVRALESELAQLRREKAERDLDRLAIEASIVAENTRRELAALRALERYIRSELTDDPRLIPAFELLKAVDEARK